MILDNTETAVNHIHMVRSGSVSGGIHIVTARTRHEGHQPDRDRCKLHAPL